MPFLYKFYFRVTKQSWGGERDEEKLLLQKNFSVEDRAQLESHHSATPDKVTD